MKITNNVFPSLYILSDDYSNKTQKKYFYFVFFLLLLTIVSEILSYFFEFNFNNTLNLCGRIFTIMLFAVIIFINNNYQKHETLWYKARSIAESIKTITWKFMMSSGEFFDLDNNTAELKLKKKLNRIKKENEDIISLFQINTNIEIITNEMKSIRDYSLADKAKLYNEERILEQEKWYIKKVNYNTKKEKLYNKLSLYAYMIVITLLFTNIFLPNINLPIDLFIIIAVSLTSWSKYKKHNELAEAYNLTIHDISFIKEENSKFDSAEKFANYVENCENAFSREHTQWYARKNKRDDLS